MTATQPLRVFSSDWHLGHAKIAGYRGFGTDVDAHDNDIIEKFKQTTLELFVRGGGRKTFDRIEFYFLGDLTAGGARAEDRATAILGALRSDLQFKFAIPFYIHAVGGNHDSWWTGQRNAVRRQLELYGDGTFDTINEFIRMQFDGERAYMSHFPWLGGGDHTDEERYTQYRLNPDGAVLIHGHTHFESATSRMRQVHVGLDAWNNCPVSYDQIATIIRTQKAAAELVADRA